MSVSNSLQRLALPFDLLDTHLIYTGEASGGPGQRQDQSTAPRIDDSFHGNCLDRACSDNS